MKPAQTAMIDLLDSTHGTDGSLGVADLLTIGMLNGTTIRVTSTDESLTLTYPTFPGDLRTGTVTFSADVEAYPIPDAETGIEIKWGLGTTLDEMTIRLASQSSNQVAGQSVLAAFTNGLMDDAMVQLERTFWPAGQQPNVAAYGTIPLFQGVVSDITEIGRTYAEFDVKDLRELLNIPMPFLVYQASCRWVFGGPGCTINVNAYAQTANVASGSGALQLNLTGPTQVSNYFNDGTLVFTSGINDGINCSVRTFTAGSPAIVLLYTALINAPSTGDTCTLYPGCDRTLATCKQKFNNQINFKGTPWVPVPESAV